MNNDKILLLINNYFKRNISMSPDNKNLFYDLDYLMISIDKLKKIDIDKYSKKYKLNRKDFIINFEN